jgi:glycerophosphoryl diester phosphodiesterase
MWRAKTVTFLFIAHRGASAEAPDNTAAAFELAIAQRADLIETDVQLTQDGVLVLEHDFEVADQSVAASRLSELRTLKPDLMTAAAALRQFGGRIPFCWELKTVGAEAALVTLVRDLLPAEMWARTHFTSFFWGSAVRLRELAPDAVVGWLTRDWSEAAIEQVRRAGLSQICPPAAALLDKPELAALAHASGLQVRVWQVTEPALIPELVRAGADGGTVNWPAAARAALDGF